jgi:hypothetical protein
MKCSSAILIVALLSSAARAEATNDREAAPVSEPPRWALGVTLGEPTGVSVKRYLGGRNAFDLNIDFVYGPGFRLGADYLWGLAQLLPDHSAADLNFYLGAGAFLGTLQGPCEGFGGWRHDCNGDAYVGGRMPIGLEVVFKRVPFSLGLEVAPGIAFAPGRAGFILDASLVARILL